MRHDRANTHVFVLARQVHLEDLEVGREEEGREGTVAGGAEVRKAEQALHVGHQDVAG